MEVVRELFEASCVTIPGHISNELEWNSFRESMISSDLLDVNDARRAERIWSRTISFGDENAVLSFDSFLDGVLLGGRNNLGEEINVKISNLKKICEEWGPDATKTAQLLSVLLILQQDHKQACKQINHMEQLDREEFLTRRKSSVHLFTNSLDYQRKKRLDVERMCNTLRVKGTVRLVDRHGVRKTSALKIADRMGHAAPSLLCTLGQTRDGANVEVIDLKSETALDDDLVFASNCHAAHRELALSKYFPLWMGHSKNLELYYQYNSEMVSVADLIRKHGIFNESQPLFQSIVRQTLSGFSDIVCQSTFSITRSVDIKQLFLTEGGSRLLFGKIAWGSKCIASEIQKWSRTREQQLMHDFGTIIRELLGVYSNSASSIASDGVVTYSGADAEAGLTVVEGTRFKLLLPTATFGKLWRCHIAESSILSLQCPDELEFLAIGPGTIRVAMQEIDWWQINNHEEENPDIVFNVTVFDKSAKYSPAIRCILSACLHSQVNSLKLVDILNSYHIFQDDDLWMEKAQEEFKEMNSY